MPQWIAVYEDIYCPPNTIYYMTGQPIGKFRGWLGTPAPFPKIRLFGRLKRS